jgi:hypothetical protein
MLAEGVGGNGRTSCGLIVNLFPDGDEVPAFSREGRLNGR